MPDYFVFQRGGGHCYGDIVRSATLPEALCKFLAHDLDAKPIAGSNLVETDGLQYHALQLAELWYKSDSKYDELQEDRDGNLLNHRSWQINRISERFDQHSVLPVLCSYEPSSISGYIELARGVFRKSHPGSRARAFVWYLTDGPLVTFYRSRDPNLDKPLEIVARYLIRWQKEKYPQPYALSSEMVEEWHGTYDDILEQFVQ